MAVTRMHCLRGIFFVVLVFKIVWSAGLVDRCRPGETLIYLFCVAWAVVMNGRFNFAEDVCCVF